MNNTHGRKSILSCGCCVICGQRLGFGVTLFRFPRIEARCKVWLNAVGISILKDLTVSQMHNRRICAAHFNENCFTSTLRNRLSKFAVPSLDTKYDITELSYLWKKQKRDSSTQTLKEEENQELTDTKSFKCRVKVEENQELTDTKSFVCRVEGCVSILPANLCLRYSAIPTRGHEVWSLEEIPAGIRFGPYETDKFQDHKTDKFRLKEEKNVNLDIKDKKEFSWLGYVSYAYSMKEWNLISVHYESEVFYITCKDIAANEQLLLWNQEIFDLKNMADIKDCLQVSK